MDLERYGVAYNYNTKYGKSVKWPLNIHMWVNLLFFKCLFILCNNKYKNAGKSFRIRKNMKFLHVILKL